MSKTVAFSKDALLDEQFIYQQLAALDKIDVVVLPEKDKEEVLAVKSMAERLGLQVIRTKYPADVSDTYICLPSSD